MIWYLLAAIVFFSSIIFAVIRYFQLSRVPTPQPPSLFVVQNLANLNPTTLASLYSKLTSANLTFEVLLRGNDKVLVLTCPLWLANSFPELKLLEIEDYTENLDPVNIIVSNYKFNSKSPIIHPDFAKEITKIDLLEGELLYYQISSISKLPKSADVEISFKALFFSSQPTRRQTVQIAFNQLALDLAGLVPVAKVERDSILQFRSRRFTKSESTKVKVTYNDIDHMLIQSLKSQDQQSYHPSH